MRLRRFTEKQIMGVLREHEAGVKTADLCRKHGISDAALSGRSDTARSRLCPAEVAEASSCQGQKFA